ncbi:DNA primase [Helicobacter sp. 23-1045]
MKTQNLLSKKGRILAMIERESIEQLKQRADIYEIVSHYVELRRTGANYTACCPFHNEKTPSFVVNPQRNIFKCFGCGEGGDCISFIMKIENLTYAEAVEKLAYLCNFTLTYTDKKPLDFGVNDSLSKIVSYYQNLLRQNSNILQYLRDRGISDESIAKFKLGFSGVGADFVAFLKRNQMPFDKLVEIGVIGRDSSNANRFFARFSGRIMFPIYATNGKAVGFGGRILSGEGAKYINSQQSKIFNKSRLLYGYNLAREGIFKKHQIIITEGYIDVIMLHQAGFTNAVATLGTALTQTHIPLISRGEVDILLCYDGDNAGINAAFKASLLLANKNGGVVIFENGKDPADMVVEGKIADLEKLFSAPIPFIKFVIQTIANRFDLGNPLQKERALNEILDFMKNLSPLLRDEYKDFVANTLQISPRLLNVRKNSKSSNTPNPNATNNRFANPSNAEEILLKSILEDNALLEVALEYLSEGIFTRKEAFLALKRGELEHKDLLGIAIDEHIKALNYADFKEQMRLFLINAYAKMLEKVKTSDLSDKINRAFAINGKINLLKKGTLVRYEENL